MCFTIWNVYHICTKVRLNFEVSYHITPVFVFSILRQRTMAFKYLIYISKVVSRILIGQITLQKLIYKDGGKFWLK